MQISNYTSCPSQLQSLTLRQQVAQRLICGYEGLYWQSGSNHYFQKLLSEGLGGTILFRENIQLVNHAVPGPFESGLALNNTLTPFDIAYSNWLIQQHGSKPCPPLFISVDQEGGQVERFPWHVFPSGISPRGISETDSINFCKDHYETIRHSLEQYGFNLNYFPTLDVNLNRQNPIIGVRSFGDDATTVYRFAKTVLDIYGQNNGVIPCIKHFPGHGHGQVDSHLTLPTLSFSETEFYTFRQTLQSQTIEKIPMIMVSHGFYPSLQGEAGEGKIPASASKSVVKDLLRKRLEFKGVVITDDMVMGAIQERWNPTEAALNCIEAGCDILLYRSSGRSEWQVFEAIVDALESGRLSLEEHEESVQRILNVKSKHIKAQFPDTNWLEQQSNKRILMHNSIQQSLNAFRIYSHNQLLPRTGPISPKTILLVYPKREEIRNYSYDIPLSKTWEYYFQEQLSDAQIQSFSYGLNDSQQDFDSALQNIKDKPDWIIFVTFNISRYPQQHEGWKNLQNHFLFKEPYSKHLYPFQVVMSSGMPDLVENFPSADLILPICTYRPHVIAALALYLKSLVSS